MTQAPRGRAGRPRFLVMAKAPVPGLVKTRLSPPLTPVDAAEVAAAALLDTLAAVETAARQAGGPNGPRPVVALAGDVRQGRRADEVAAALGRFDVIDQRGDGLAQRIANAHLDARGTGSDDEMTSVVQVGMDTPQLLPEVLVAAADAVGPGGPDAALGVAADGGWWVLALADPTRAALLVDVPMSTDHTGRDTLKALHHGGLSVGELPVLTDVDTWDDAVGVARHSPPGHFAAVVERVTRDLAVVDR